jgi:WD40 repeat protein
VELSRDGRLLVTTGTAADGSAACLLWDVGDPAKPTRIGEPLPIGCYQMALSPDGTLLAVGARVGTVQLWDLTDRARPRALDPPLKADREGVSMLTFSADGTLLASGGSERAVLLWDVRDRARPSRIAPPLTGNTGLYIWSAAFAPDGRTLATGGDDNLLLWDLSEPQRPQPLGIPLTLGLVLGVAFSPDGGLLAVASKERPVELWDLTDRTQPRQLGGQLARTATPLAFATDGRTLITGGPGTGLTLLDLVPLADLRADPLQAACARVGTSLARETWAFYAPDVEYRDACANG